MINVTNFSDEAELELIASCLRGALPLFFYSLASFSIMPSSFAGMNVNKLFTTLGLTDLRGFWELSIHELSSISWFLGSLSLSRKDHEDLVRVDLFNLNCSGVNCDDLLALNV